MAKCGRKPVEDYAKLSLCEATVTELASLGATHEDIANLFGVSVDTINHKYMRAFQKGKEVVKLKLRAKQLECALHYGNNVMLIWLGKQLMGQAEKIEEKTQISGDPISIVFSVENVDKSVDNSVDNSEKSEKPNNA